MVFSSETKFLSSNGFQSSTDLRDKGMTPVSGNPGRRAFLVRARTAALLFGLWLGVSQCGGDGSAGDQQPDTKSSFLFAVISDIHIAPDEN